MRNKQFVILLTLLNLVFVSITMAQNYREIDGLKWKKVSQNAQYGVSLGHAMVIPAKYKSIAYHPGTFDYGVFACYTDSNCDLYTYKGKLFYSHKHGDYIKYSRPLVAGNKVFHLILKQHTRIYSSHENYYYEVLDSNGNIVINESQQLNDISILSCNGKYLFYGCRYGDKGFVALFDLKGKKLIESNRGTGVGVFYNGGYFLTIYKGGAYHGIYNLRGEEKFSPDEGRITWDDGSFYCSPEGANSQVKIHADLRTEIYPKKLSLKSGVYTIAMRNKQCGLLSPQGKTLIPFAYDDIVYCSLPGGHSYYACGKGSAVAIYSTQGKCIIPLFENYSEVLPVGRPGKVMFLAMQGANYALLDELGNTVIPLSFRCEDIEYVGNSYKLTKNGCVALYSMDGKAIIPFERKYSSITLNFDAGFMDVKSMDGKYGVCDMQGVERIKSVYKFVYCKSDRSAFVAEDMNGGKHTYKTWFANEAPQKVQNYNLTEQQNSHSSATTYYHFVSSYTGTLTAGTNRTLSVAFNSNGTVSAFGRLWKYNNRVGLSGQAGWVNGNDYLTVSNDRSELTFYHRELIGGLILSETAFEVYTLKPYTRQQMQNYCNTLNSARTPVSGTTSGNFATKSSGNQICRKCNGKGTIIVNTYPPQYSGGVTGKKKCYQCNEWFNISLGHSHVTCGACGGTGRIR